MKSFKYWLEDQNNTPNFGNYTTQSMSYPEAEFDNFIPDENHIRHALDISGRIQGFFPAFRSRIKDQAILMAFTDALKMGLPSNGSPLNYSKSDYLNDEIQQYIAQRVKMPFDQVEPYCERLKSYFVNIIKNMKSNWDGTQPEDNFPNF